MKEKINIKSKDETEDFERSTASIGNIDVLTPEIKKPSNPAKVQANKNTRNEAFLEIQKGLISERSEELSTYEQIETIIEQKQVEELRR